MPTWRKKLKEALELNNETFADIESNTMSDAEMDADHWSDGDGRGCSFTVWTKNKIYFPMTYDGDVWAGSVSRNPDGKPTDHQGGG